MSRSAIAVTLLIALAGPTSASEESEALSARAMVELKRGNGAEAMGLFDRAVAADPRDAVATFHRGVALSKQGESARAIADFESTLALRPDLDEAALELGIALVESGRPEEARARLEQARARPELAGQAEFFLGIAALRAERYDDARANLERARAADPTLATVARYYLGVIDYRSGDRVAAREHFTEVTQRSPDSAVGREAAAFLDVLRADQGAGNRIYGGASLQYDSNVVLAPQRGLPGISGKSDGRATLNAGGIYEVWRGERTQVSLGYDFYQDLHFELTDFNVQNHRPSLLVSTDFGRVRGVFLANYDFYILDTTRWLQSASAMPMLILPQGDIGRLEAYVRFEWSDYMQSRFDILNGYNTAGGVRQVLTLGAPGRVLWGSFEVDSQDSDVSGGELYEYNGVQGELSLRWPLPWTTAGQLGYRFRREDYNDASNVFVPTGRSRLDYEHRLGAGLRKQLTDMITLVAAWVGTWNESNKDDFEYDRHIVSLGVELRY